MSWVKMDDGMPRHRKTRRMRAQVGKARMIHARGVWATMLCDASAEGTDGFLSNDYLSTEWSEKEDLESIELMLRPDVGILDRVEGGLQMHDFLDYNPSKKERESRAKQASERQQRWRESRNDEESNALVTRLHARDMSVSNAAPGPARPLLNRKSLREADHVVKQRLEKLEKELTEASRDGNARKINKLLKEKNRLLAGKAA